MISATMCWDNSCIDILTHTIAIAFARFETYRNTILYVEVLFIVLIISGM